MDRTVKTEDGRTLAVTEGGDPRGKPVLAHMGTPMSRLQYGPIAHDAARRGLRLITYDRPGYGGSTAQPGRTVADCAADVEAICAELDIDRLATWGVSGGGPHVLACAALLPGRVVAAASLASPAPYGADGLDYYDGMGELNADDTRLMFSDPQAARDKLEEEREESLTATPEQLAEAMESLLSPADAAAMTGELAEFVTESTRQAVAPGGQGWWDDSLAAVLPWGFELSAISVPVVLVHGRQDRFVPFGHGQWLAAHIPGVEAWLLDDDGHLTLMQNRVSDVHAWLADRL